MRTEVKAALAACLGTAVASARSVGGGDINDAWRLELADGRRVFVKTNDHAPADMFACEEAGLAALRAPEILRLPDVLGRGVAGATHFLVLAWIESGAPAVGFAERFGRGLAELHRQSREAFGFDGDNYIGSLPQTNRRHSRWVDFFREERLGGQLALAASAGSLSKATLRRAEQLLARLEDWLPRRSPVSLLHGDLWSGNFMLDERGEAVLIDPATYFGDREIEIAFTELFGGFPGAFYAAYQEAWPLDPGYRERRDLYNLYPLLVHANLFGGHYASRVDRVIKQVLR